MKKVFSLLESNFREVITKKEVAIYKVASFHSMSVVFVLIPPVCIKELSKMSRVMRRWITLYKTM